jgi:glycosyltransferase involved in cell wall biosynthesis
VLLSLLIPTLVCRREYLALLQRVLGPQTRDNPQVESIVFSDDGERSIGTKRNQMVAMARGDYIAFIDDDDLVAPDYVARVIEALKTRPAPDCVGFRMKRYSNGRPIGEGIHSIRFECYGQKQLPEGMTLYERTPNHLNPIRADLVRQVPFPDLNWGEDSAFARGVRPLLKSEVFIDEYLYMYYYRTPYVRRGETVNAGAGGLLRW